MFFCIFLLMRMLFYLCIVIMEDKDSFLYVKVKIFGEKNGKIERLFIVDKYLYIYMDRLYFLF